MRKFVWLPVIDLGHQTKGQFLEIMSEPAHYGGINMDALASFGLTNNIITTQNLLKRLNHQPNSAYLYLTHYLANISNTQGINLALAIACFMQVPSCPYQKIMVTGQLNTTQDHLTVSAAVHFEAKIQAIVNLGKQAQPTPFFFPQAMYTKSNTPLLLPLEALNIMLKPIESLFDVLKDFGMSDYILAD